jgi:hypothetical protein
MPASDDNDRDQALLRRLYDEPDADGADGELAREVESYQRVRGAIADYARATEVEPPSRGLDELLAAARQRAAARPAAVAPEPAGFWARLRAWLAPITSHPALASAAMVVLVAGVAGVLYMKGKTPVSETEVGGARSDHVAVGSAPAATETAPGRDRDHGMLAGLDDGGQGSATEDNQAVEQSTDPKPATPETTPTKDKRRPAKRPAPVNKETEGQGGGGGGGGETSGEGASPTPPAGNIAVGPGKVVTERGDGDESVPVTEPAVPVQPGVSTTKTTTLGAGAAEDELRASRDELEVTDSGTVVGKDAVTSMEQLTRQARTAAKSGACGVVKKIGGKVKKSNATYYKQTFSADAAIKKCL